MRLPDSLTPWHAWLGWFEPELAGMLGDLLLRLHPLLGAFRMRALSGAVEPEGIDDLRRRGSYERLLLSEWALAETVPEEFDRRAASGEHLFLSPKLVAREVDALTVAVFDTGPTQLGAARLVHVAMWILLAQRAQVAKARFAWGVLGKPGELHQADSDDALRQLLSERSFTPGGEAAWQQAAGQGLAPPREQHEQAWAKYLDAARPSPGERWSIGSHAHGYGLGHRVDVQRVDRDALAVVIAARQARRETRLRLPDPDRSSRILRGRFGAVAQETLKSPVTGKLSLQQPPLISFGGRCIGVVVTGENAIRIYRRPRFKDMPQPAPRTTQWGKHDRLLAGALTDRHFGGVIADPEKLGFWRLGPMRKAELPPSEELDLSTRHARLLSCLYFEGPSKHGDGARLFLLTEHGRLLSWTRRKWAAQGMEYRFFAGNVLAIARADPLHILLVRQYEGYLHCELVGMETSRLLERIALPGAARTGFVCGRWFDTGWHGGVCVELPVGGHGGERSSIWKVFLRSAHRSKSSDHEIVLPAGWKVIGLSMSATEELELIALRPDRKAIVCIGVEGRAVLYESPYAIATASVATDCDVIAAVDRQGRLVVLRERASRVAVYEDDHDD